MKNSSLWRINEGGLILRRLWLPLLCVTVVMCIGFILFSKTYTITNGRTQLEDNILGFINRNTVVIKNIDIKQELNLDNKKYVLFTIKDGLGEAELTNDFNNKYKIESAGYGSAFFRYDIMKTNKGKYLILEGKNYDNKISYTKVLLDNREYKIIIPQQKYFIVYCSVPIETQKVFLEPKNLKFYSSKDIDITKEMFGLLY